ncbi:MAG TPA: 50S ribosomal protein L11 methyltransferase [Planctomycetota bacterium]|nr:50S ribosomal protein L11 methyltransferase [Planctomycetota bacterium]
MSDDDRASRLEVSASRCLSIVVRRGVHPIDPYAGRFAASLRVSEDDRVLDLGCGAGTYGLAAAAHGAAHVVATDIDPAAITCTLENARRNGFAERFTGRVGSLFEPVARERFDVIVTTLPQLPAPKPVIATRYGGPDGLDLLRELAGRVGAHLTPGGRLYLLVTGWAGPERVAELLASRGLSVRVVARADRAFQPAEYDAYCPGLFRYLDEHARDGKAYSRKGAWRYLRVEFLEATRSGLSPSRSPRSR